MCALFSPGSPPVRYGAESLYVGGQRYANSAAKFWTALIDEVAAQFPACTEIELAATLSGPLHRDHLYPARSLSDQAQELLHRDFGRVMRETVAELEMFGPPAAVRILLRTGEADLWRGAAPAECLDAETFPCVLVWLLEWARIADSRWNGSSLAGSVEGTDYVRRQRYTVRFSLTRESLSEGLEDRILTLSAQVAAGVE